MGRKPNKLKTTNPFLEAITFVGTALKEQGTHYETHLYLNNNWAIANNGVLAIGCPISWPSLATPNYSMFSNALIKCGVDWELVKTDNTLDIHAGKFRAIVPCCDPILITLPTIDPPITAISNAFRDALGKVAMLANDNAQSVIEASILMNGQSIVGTDRTIIIEAWHGCDLPPGLALPKAFAVALCKIAKNLKAFGYSDNSATFYFEDPNNNDPNTLTGNEPWVKTQLFADSWPDINAILNRGSNPPPVPKGIWDGLTAVKSFSNNNLVYFDSDILCSSSDSNMGARYEVAGLPKGPIFNIKYLEIMKNLATSVDFFAGNATMWFGDACRGAIANRVT